MWRSFPVFVVLTGLACCAGPAPLVTWGLKGAPAAVLLLEEPDHDRDGVENAHDRCPDLPEDEDGYRDDDGCPDPDNDGDGIPDAKDETPNAKVHQRTNNGCGSESSRDS